MAKAIKKDQDTPVVVPSAGTAEQVEQASQGAADADVAEAPVSKDSLPTPPAAAEISTDAATSDADFEKLAAVIGSALARNTVKAFIVTSARNGFRRAGIRFSTEPITLHAANLTQEQIDLIMDEPMLEVVSVEAVAEQ